MKFVKQEILDYTSTEITESVAQWVSTTTYAVGDTVLRGNYIWKNSFTANLNNEPVEGSNKWVKWGVSNKYSLIDLRSSTATVTSTDCTITFDRGNMDTLIVGNFTATSFTIENISADGLTVYHTQTFTQSANGDVVDYYTYFYSAYTLESDRGIYFTIPQIGDKLRISFVKGTFAQVKIGFIVGGIGQDMGKTLEGVKVGFTSYSKTAVDDFGIIKITKRSAQDLVDFETMIPSDRLMSIRRKAKEYRDEIVGFIVDESTTSVYENIVTLGVMQDIQPIATNFDKTTITWSILESI